jgi:HlyD family secretion protein
LAPRLESKRHKIAIMDKIIAEEVVAGKRRKLLIAVLVLVSALSLGVISLRKVLGSSVHRSEITTAVVEQGAVENTISASGEIVPEFEQVITSPVSASIKEVLVDAGKNVHAGEAILQLDKSASQAEYEKLKFQWESKRNEIQKLKLELEKSFSDLKSNNDVKQLRINSLEAALEDAKRLYKAGGGTREDIQQADLNLKVAQLEKKQLESEILNKQQSMRIEMKESEIAAAIQESDLKELARKLQLANIVASRPGVITWVNRNIGASVHEGESLVRVADLSSFKVTGSISDSYLDQLHHAMPALVRINDTTFRGVVANINPSVQNGLISFDVQLDTHNHPLFRPNMKVDVYLVTESRKNTMRVANGPAFKGGQVQDVFVVNGNTAERRTVHIGLTNFDYVELKDNVKPGDVVITSDMSNYKNTKSLTIKN